MSTPARARLVGMAKAKDEGLAAVIPLRSDEEELELLETAVLDELDDRDAEYVEHPDTPDAAGHLSLLPPGGA